jgi:hypothetical protein
MAGEARKVVGVGVDGGKGCGSGIGGIPKVWVDGCGKQMGPDGDGMDGGTPGDLSQGE